jgi:four helix bundle protein
LSKLEIRKPKSETRKETKAKTEVRNPKSYAMDERRPYDLEDRTRGFAQRVRKFVKRLPRTVANLEDIKQLVKSSGSTGANYIEANESLGKKDFLMRIRIARKEAKETGYWLHLVVDCGTDPGIQSERNALVQESTELMRILAAILRKSE